MGMAPLRTTTALAVAMLAAATATAEPPDAAGARRPAFRNLPFEEDWSVLRDGVEPASFLDPIKYISLDEEGDFWLSFGGQLRGRVEIWNNFLFGASMPKDDDAFFLSRIRLHTDVHLTPYVRVFAEFKSSLSTSRDLLGGKRSIDFDDADLQNGFGELRLPLGGVQLGVRGGRQELQFGAQRLVSPLDWANTRRTFDGALAYGEGEGWKVSGFWSRPVRVKKHAFNDSSPNFQFFGLYSEVALPVRELSLDLYWLGLLFDVIRPANRVPGDGVRHTLGGRLHGVSPGTPLLLDIEGAAQLGNVRSADILAGMFSAKLTWPFSAPLAPAVYAGYDWASGDSGKEGQVGTFDQLFPLGHAYLGFIDAVARQNIQAVHLGGKFSPLKKSAVAMTWHAFWLDDGNDALYAASGAPIRFDPAASSKHVGVEMDLTLSYEFARGLVALAGYSHFFTGRFIEQSGPDENTDFGYLQLQYTF
jgi:hypothetical protein